MAASKQKKDDPFVVTFEERGDQTIVRKSNDLVQRKNCKFTQGFTVITLCKMQHPRCGLPYILWGLQPGCRLHRVLLCFSVLLFQGSVT